MPVLTTPELTTAEVTGSGIFDVLMKAVKAHLDQEFHQSRIKGPEFATVYLGSMELAMQTGLTFLLQKEKNALEADLIAKQIELANVQVQKAQAELVIIQAQQLKVPAEIAELQARTALLGQQKDNLAAEELNIPKQGALLDAQVTTAQKQIQIADAEILIKEQQVLNAQAEVAMSEAKLLNIPKEGKVLDAQECKLKAEFDLIVKQTTKTDGEIALLAQKTATERAQTQAIGVDDNSVVGKQKLLYGAQTDGFKRDAEQKTAKLLVDTWSVRRTTDEATAANATNMLHDSAVGRAVTKMLDGVGA